MQAPSRSAKVEAQFVGDGEYDLCLRIDQLIALQERLGTGPIALYNRIVGGQWLVQDLIETIRLALIGGGMGQQEAYRIVKSYVVEGELLHYQTVAQVALFACLYGVENGEEEEAQEDPLEAPTNMDSFDGAQSLSSEEQPASIPEN